jgi:hypothetical protein
MCCKEPTAPHNTTTDTRPIERNKTTKTKHPIGTTITKCWNGIPYTGTIISHNGIYYKVKYDDNNEEELNHNEINRYMNKE